MEINEYNEIVQQWMTSVFEHSGRDAELTLKACNDLIDYGKKTEDSFLMGFGYYHIAETYYCLNDGDNLFENISRAINYLERAECWDLVAKSYIFLGIAAQNRGNAPIAMDYYMNGKAYCEKYDIPMVEMLFNINCGALCVQNGRYDDAEAYLQNAYAYISRHSEDPAYHAYMICIYQNLARVKVYKGEFEGIDNIFHEIHKKHWPFSDYIDKIAVLCAEALYYHRSNQHALRNECISQIDVGITENMALMDMFQDIYDYCLLLLECDMDQEFWHIVEILEPMIKSFKIIDMQLKQLTLKIKYYRKHKKYADFLQGAGLYYELSERREVETRNMINNVLQLRKRLEVSDKQRMAVEEENQLLADKSEKDALTGLPNRFKLDEFAEAAFARATQNETSFAIEILDIDYFKEYNDNYGHQAGDDCLVAVADCIRTVADNHEGFCARYGGDEFVIIYEDATRAQAQEYCRELKELVTGKNIEHKYSKAFPFVTVSQGVCCDVPDGTHRVWDLLHNADDNLYVMKKSTRNDYCVAGIQD